MISHNHRCIFVHIPKCGGTSVEDALWKGPRSEADLWAGSHFEGGFRQSLHHLYARQIKAKVGDDVFARYFKIAFVRNPWDRAVSKYVYIRRGWPYIRHGWPVQNMKRAWNFATFKSYLDTVERVRDTRWEPQLTYLTGRRGEIIVDHVARFEAINEEFTTICEKIGITALSLPHKKKSFRKGYQDYYSSDTRDRIKRIYRDDIDAFGYSF